MDAPKVSVVIPVFNGERFLAPAIESILDQSFTDFELLVVDDGSTDTSPDIVERYRRTDRRIRLLSQVQQGVSKARNSALSQAQGTYLAWLDADDVAHPNRLAVQAAFLDAHPDIVILGSAFRQIDEWDQASQVHVMPQDDTLIRWQALFHSPFAQSTVMQRLDTFRRYQLKYSLCDFAEDYELSSCMLRYGRGWNLSEPLGSYRVHSNQETHIKSEQISGAAVEIAQRNIRQVGLDLKLDAVSRLREWYYRYPRRLAGADMALAFTLLDLVDAFSRQSDLDTRQIRKIRGKTVLRFLRATLRSPAMSVKGIAACLRADRIGALAAVGMERLLQRRR